MRAVDHTTDIRNASPLAGATRRTRPSALSSGRRRATARSLFTSGHSQIDSFQRRRRRIAASLDGDGSAAVDRQCHGVARLVDDVPAARAELTRSPIARVQVTAATHRVGSLAAGSRKRHSFDLGGAGGDEYAHSDGDCSCHAGLSWCPCRRHYLRRGVWL